MFPLAVLRSAHDCFTSAHFQLFNDLLPPTRPLPSRRDCARSITIIMPSFEIMGVSMVLVGETLMRAEDPGKAIRTLLGEEEPTPVRRRREDTGALLLLFIYLFLCFLFCFEVCTRMTLVYDRY